MLFVFSDILKGSINFSHSNFVRSKRVLSKARGVIHSYPMWTTSNAAQDAFRRTWKAALVDYFYCVITCLCKI